MKRLALIIFMILCSQQAIAKEYFPFIESKFKKVKSFGQWFIFAKAPRYDNDHKACFTLSTPTQTKAFSGVRDLPYFLVSYNATDEFSVSAVAGYTIDEDMILNTNNVSYILNRATEKFAFTASSVQDKAIIEELIKDGYSFELKSYNTSNETALDLYSLNGFKEALSFMQNNCSKLYDQIGSTETTSGI